MTADSVVLAILVVLTFSGVLWAYRERSPEGQPALRLTLKRIVDAAARIRERGY